MRVTGEKNLRLDFMLPNHVVDFLAFPSHKVHLVLPYLKKKTDKTHRWLKSLSQCIKDVVQYIL